MRVLMVLDNKFPPDLRVEKEAVSLVNNGFDVGILSIGNYEKDHIVDYKGITIYRVALSKFLRDKMHGLAAMIPWVDRYIAKQVLKILESKKYDVVHLHDLYLFGAAKILRDKTDIKLVGDLHENYIDALKDYKWSTTYPNKLFISFKKWERKEKEWLQYFDHLIAVNEGMREKNISKGVKEEDITVVANSIDTDVFDSYEIDSTIIERFKNYNTLVYVGGFVWNRGLEHVVKGMSALKKHDDNIRLLLVGDGEMRSELEELTKLHGVSDVVIFEGFQAQEKIKSYLLASKIGLIPFKRTPQTDNSSSNKLYQYMYYSLPILGTNCTSVEKLIEEEKCGLIYESEKESEFVEGVIKLLEESDLAKEFGMNGKESVLKKYNWKVEEKKLIDIYNTLKRG